MKTHRTDANRRAMLIRGTPGGSKTHGATLASLKFLALATQSILELSPIPPSKIVYPKEGKP